MLGSAPVLALTATATVRVQDDILAQLGIPGARRFIRGFRRDNLGIEAYERPRGERIQEVIATLAEPTRRPAIVYVPTRKLAEEVAEVLAKSHRAMAYHAGLDASARGRAQEAFLRGEVEVIVATIAFGMGIDKSDIRTVIHMALPGTLEGYYQEIGRAGRDGLPARALLLYSFGDRKVHESFLERDYPETPVLEALRGAVPVSGIDREALLAQSGLAPDLAEPALDKLWIHGGLAIDGEDRVRLGREGWQAPYEAIRAHRGAQLEEIVEFAESSDCRMVRLVRHFGDTRDRHPCGQCDHCRPQDCVGRSFRAPSAAELQGARRIVEELERFDGVSTGTLYRNLHPGGDDGERRPFERMLQALVRAGVLALTDDAFAKDGRTIRFRRANLKPGARAALGSERFQVEEEAAHGAKSPRKRGGGGSPAGKRPDRKKRSSELGQAAQEAGADARAVERLRAWRRARALEKRIPAFRILTDRTLLAIAVERPQTLAELRSVSGAGPKLVEKHGAAILAALRLSGAV
jgi:DNA topoisomerase-3